MPGNKRIEDQENHETEKTEEIEIEIEIEHIQDNKGFYNAFLKEQVIGSFKPELINNSKLEPFVVNVKKNSSTDQEVLESWKRSFQGFLFGKKTEFVISYVVTENPKTKVKTLWKEKIK